MNPPKIVVFGTIIQDLISYTERFPQPGETVRGTEFLSARGGKSANQAVAAARLGAQVTLIAKVGDDVLGEENIKGLQESGVNVDRIEKSSEKSTGTALITVDARGDHIMVVTLGANLELDESSAIRNADELNDADVVIAQARVCQSGNKKMFELARERGVLTLCNPAPSDHCEDRSIMELVDIFCVNELEAALISQITVNDVDDAKAAAAAIQRMGPRNVIITLGPNGCVFKGSDEQAVHIPGKPSQVVDTTGAGDCFCGSLAFFIAHNQRRGIHPSCDDICIRDAIEKASAIASLSVTRKGAQTSYWTRDEVLLKYPEIFN